MLTTTHATITNPRNRRSPMWLFGGERPATDAFKSDLRCNCIDQWHFFFSDDLSEQAVAKKLCATCPMLRPCTRWTLDNFLDLPHGIFAGMEPEWRERIYRGKERYWDWAKEFSYAEQVAKAAARRRARGGLHKREQRRQETPPCPGCGSNQYVYRAGRSRPTKNRTGSHQQYRCMACGPPRFLGEEL